MIGETFGSYRVVRRLGQGGMGVVYIAEHPLLGKKAVVKQLLPELSQNPEIVQRFFNEARAATMIQHPGIVDVFDFGYHASGSAFIAMEFLPGEALAARLEREKPLRVDVAILIVRQAASAVGAAHAAGIVHRDLKPDNVFLVPQAEAPGGLRVKVLDFGIAKLAGTIEAAGVKTRTGSVMGTPTYMAPEQCHGAAELDHRADIYALGCILFELVSGRPPFVGDGLGEILAAHMFTPPPPLRSLAPWCPEPLEALTGWMLAKHAGDRPQTLEVVIEYLDAVAAPGPAPLTPPRVLTPVPSPGGPSRSQVTTLGGAAGPLPSAAPTARRKPVGLIVGLGGAALAIAVAVLMVARGGAREAPAPRADAPSPRATSDACRDGDGAACEPICQRGDAPACANLARWLVTGAGGLPSEPARGVSLATRGCAAKLPVACLALAIARRDGIGIGLDITAAVAAATQACDGGLGLGCALAGPMLAMQGDADAADAVAARARPLLATACDTGDDASCIALASLVVKGAGGDRELTRAAQLLQTSCDRRPGEACARLARMYELGQGLRADPARARELIRAARTDLSAQCEQHAAWACGLLAAGLLAGPVADRDATRVTSLMTSACDGGDGASCLASAAMHAVGDGVPRDRTLAGERYRRAVTRLQQQCTAGDAAACVRSAQVLSRGLGVRKDTTRAIELMRSACRVGSGAGCAGWAELDPPQAAVAFEQALAIAEPACAAGDLSSCDLAGDVLTLGPATVARPAEGAAYYQRACDGGLAEGCFDLAWTRRADSAAANALYTRACDDGFGPACANLGMAAGAAGDGAAARYFEQGCDRGDGMSCEALARDLASTDPARARTLRERACVVGFQAACNE